ncbi:putative NOT transcription complex subunit VIP2 [Primulina tabacum]|uniref:putative NOT transcription complex subunit VIP2 n=1 Tax=Primulina tabacum TaxID=48773 RepID=UPI003F59C3EF
MWRPETSNKSNSNRVDTNGTTFMTPYSTSFGSSSVVSNESGGNNSEGLHNSTHECRYLPGSYASRSSTNNVGLPSGVQQAQGSLSSVRNTPYFLTNEPSQLCFGGSHGHSSVTNTGGPPLIPTRPPFFPSKPPLVPNKGHTARISNNIGGFVSGDGSSSSSTGLAVVPSPAFGFNSSAPCMVPIHGNSHIGAPMPLPQNQFQDVPGHYFSYMGLLNDSNVDAAANVDVNGLCHLSGYYSSVGDPQSQPGGLNIGNFVDYGATQHQKEHLVQLQQHSMGRSPDFVFDAGAINSHDHPLQQNHVSSITGTGFSFPPPGNQDLHFHGSGQYQHVQQSQPHFYNILRRKEVNPRQGSRLGPDDYGLLGLLKIIKGVNPAKTALAMGVDPHSLGLELNSPEPLHQKFTSPWSDEHVKEGPKYHIPDCYISIQPPPLQRSHFKKFHLPMLFYVFYSMPNDQAQLLAANELHDRGWYYHRELRMWFTPVENSAPSVKNATYEVGCYVCFDPTTWQTVRQDNVVLHYNMIEERPAIPQ